MLNTGEIKAISLLATFAINIGYVLLFFSYFRLVG